jgi:hypothetical protein
MARSYSRFNPDVPIFVPGNANALTRNPANATSLTGVPPEIRILYKALFAGFNFEAWVHSGYHYALYGSEGLGILSVCRLIHDEGVPYLSALSTVWHKLSSVSARPLDDLVPAKYLQSLKLAVFEFCGLGSVDWDCLGQIP